MIYGPHFSQINRLQPVDKDRQEEQQDPSKKKKGVYNGRSWSETDEKLPVQPKQQDPPPQKRATIMYADRILLEKAQKYFESMTTLEEKAAQLFFLEVEAAYDMATQHETELLLQAWQLGGILFKKGEYRRQTYLIERFQEISKTPVLFANDFLHGLSFYLQGDSLKSGLSSQHFMDLGKAVMVQNRRMGVHVQFDRERGLQKVQMTEAQAKAFRKGIREAQGIVGKQKNVKTSDSFSNTYKSVLSHFTLRENSLESGIQQETNIRETNGYKSLTFFDLFLNTPLEESILMAYRELYDTFLVPNKYATEAIKAICKLVRGGKIAESDLDRRVMKILIIKALYSK